MIFYDDSLECSAEIREHFADVSRAEQKVFAHNGVPTIPLYAMGSAKSQQRIDLLDQRHGPKELARIAHRVP